jgi:hypothetical protein
VSRRAVRLRTGEDVVAIGTVTGLGENRLWRQR